MKLFVIGFLLLVSNMSVLAADFTITPLPQQESYSVGGNWIFLHYKFRIKNNLPFPLYLHDRYVSGAFPAKPASNQPDTNCHFYVDDKTNLIPLRENEECITEFEYVVDPSKGEDRVFPLPYM